ncbi:uncharacterized protein LY89DRAFT_403808 [Mollisia scopiformis]|uniref:Uncharacterized protein n=1 Tax=Mollisia scopiformis TaxID=149040 RepID=A0A132B2Q8_MOLSC|nr:uncharacterized protein LY89DRAFT_403808 [Mollisia scopiformis]KUJ06688.1 hypothetical protein LY89DRAFT_403808 [Mollisia scopiformis]
MHVSKIFAILAFTVALGSSNPLPVREKRGLVMRQGSGYKPITYLEEDVGEVKKREAPDYIPITYLEDDVEGVERN